MAKRFSENPLLTTKSIEPSQPGFVVEGILNPGVFEFEGKIWLLLRVAERPVQKEGWVSFPVLRPDGSLEIREFEKTDPKIRLVVSFANRLHDLAEELLVGDTFGCDLTTLTLDLLTAESLDLVRGHGAEVVIEGFA